MDSGSDGFDAFAGMHRGVPVALLGPPELLRHSHEHVGVEAHPLALGCPRDLAVQALRQSYHEATTELLVPRARLWDRIPALDGCSEVCALRILNRGLQPVPGLMAGDEPRQVRKLGCPA